MPGLQHIVPGTRIRVRDAEWRVRRSALNSRSGQVIKCVGLSEVVRDKDAIFIEGLERSIEIVDPTEVELVADKSSYYKDARLFVEGQLLRAIPTGLEPVIADRAAIDKLGFQLEPVRKALGSLRVRLLIADDVGLGKTLEAGMLAAELIRRGRAKRILVVATKSMLTQFQKEFWCRFSISLTRLDSVGIRRVRNRIPGNHNPFHFFERAIISIDTLKNDLQYRSALENAYWDLIIIDEAHNVAERSHAGGRRSQRHILARRLAKVSDSLVMLSATPHDGRRRSFASLMTMLDPTSIADVETYGPDDIKGLFLRRFRTSPEVREDLGGAIPERQIEKLQVPASSEEEAAYSVLARLRSNMPDGARWSRGLFILTIEKALFSSPAACAESLRKRISRLEAEDSPVAVAEVGELASLLERVERICKDSFSRYTRLLQLLTETGWRKRNSRDRLVIFTERIATLNWLAQALRNDLNMSDKQVVTLHGQMSDQDIQQRVDDFGQQTKPVRILIASDLASEGINLHFQSHRLIHFDLPWSLMTFQQRNGRIDRYGQENPPLIWYLCTECQEPLIGGDFRILEVLIEKDQAIYESLGDPLSFFDSQERKKQEDEVESAIRRGEGAAGFSERLDKNANRQDSFEQLLAQCFSNSEALPTTDTQASALPSLFEDVFSFCKSAVEHLRPTLFATGGLECSRDTIAFDVPQDFLERGHYGSGTSSKIDTRWMPREAVPQQGRLRLTSNLEKIASGIKAARQNDERSWPELQYLWEIHPVVEWLSDKTAGLFPGRQVPVMAVGSGLSADEVLFIMNGVVPNRRGQPLIDAWPCIRFVRHDGVDFRGRSFSIKGVMEFADIMPELDLLNPIPNTGNLEIADLETLVVDAVTEGRHYIRDLCSREQARIDDDVIEELDKHEKLQLRRAAAIKTKYRSQGGIAKVTAARQKQELEAIDRQFDEIWKWQAETRQTSQDPTPYVRLVAVMRGLPDGH